MPKHDKPGIILDLSRMDGKPLYIVSYPDKPALRIGVRVAEILDYVSPRTLENWEIEQETLIEENRKAKARAQAQAKGQSKKEAIAQTEPQVVEASRVVPGTVRGRGRPKRKRDDEEGVGNVSVASTGLGVKAAGSRKKQARATLPSLSSPPQQFDPYDSESDFEDGDTAAALDRQINGSAFGTRSSGLGAQEASSGYASPQPVNVPKKLPPATQSRNTRSSSRQTRSTSATPVQVLDNGTGPRNQPRRGSVAMTSSVEFANMYENLEKGKTRKSTLSEIRPATFYNYSSPTKAQTSTKSASAKQDSVQPASTKPEPAELAVAPVDSDEEYEVDYIIDDKYQKDKKGKKVRYYLIKWVGNWPNSWEPETNVGSEVIALYKKKRAEWKKAMSITPSVVGENGENGKTTMEDAGWENGGEGYVQGDYKHQEGNRGQHSGDF
ncbi:hypothetical protein BDZ45DRAFT_667905 [Acephala macrosclerotiorum]|nr:hypothetical protein BDZ45DRAFT_667905 [Acephala macrosclerotiorum]